MCPVRSPKELVQGDGGGGGGGGGGAKMKSCVEQKTRTDQAVIKPHNIRISVVLHLFVRSYFAVLKAKFAENVHLFCL